MGVKFKFLSTLLLTSLACIGKLVGQAENLEEHVIHMQPESLDSILIVTDSENRLLIEGLIPSEVYYMDFFFESMSIEESWAIDHSESEVEMIQIVPSGVVFVPMGDQLIFDFSLGEIEGSTSIFFTLETKLYRRANPPKKSRTSTYPGYRLDPIVIDSSGTVEDIVLTQFISSPCFNVRDIVYEGDPERGFGTFSNADDILGFEEGIVMSTGAINALSGPNLEGNDYGFGTSDNVNGQSDPDLDLLEGSLSPINEAQTLSMTFTAPADSLFFNYIFGSEEYCEFVESSFNDVFGFFLSGPGISGVFSNQAENIALIPGTNDFVAIQTVNFSTNGQFYVDNIDSVQNQGPFGGCTEEEVMPSAFAPLDIILDGYTVPLSAIAELVPCEDYSIKLAIADVADGAFSSSVFLEANSFSSNEEISVNVTYQSGEQFALEGCTEEEVCLTFSRGAQMLSERVVLGIEVDAGSTATPEVDFIGFPDSLVFESGDSLVELCIDVVPDNIDEGQESLVINIQGLCECVPVIFELFIEDSEDGTIEIQEPDIITCGTTVIDLVAVSSDPDVLYEWTTLGGSIVGDTNTATIQVDQAGLYIVNAISEIIVCNTRDTVQVFENTDVPIININGVGDISCANEVGFIDVAGSSLGMDFSYLWIGPSGDTINPPNPLIIDAPERGDYQLTITDLTNFCDSTVTIAVDSIGAPLVADFTIVPTECFIDRANVSWSVAGAQPPVLPSLDSGQTFLNVSTLTNLPFGEYFIVLEDANGCRTETNLTVDGFIIPEIRDWVEFDTILLGESYEISYEIFSGAEAIDSFIWTTVDTTLSCTGCPFPTVSPAFSREYHLTILTVDGCELNFTLNLIVDRTPDIYIPNVFSPNGDQINDVFNVFANPAEVSKVNRLDIYSRWGEKVFSVKNIPHSDAQYGWNGRFEGDNMLPGVYIYLLEVELTSGEVLQINGDLTLIR